MIEQVALNIAIGFLVQNAPAWLDDLSGTLLGKGKDFAIEKGIGYGRSILHLDDKEQAKHLGLALKNAVERGLARFDTLEQRDQYRDVLTILSEPGPHSDALRREALRIFTLSDTPNFAELNEVYNRSLRTRTLSQPTPPTEVDAAPCLSSFFEALLAELYIDPFFHDRISDVLKVRSAQSMQRSLTEVVTTLRQIGETIAENYTPQQFERDVETYTAHIARTLHYLKLVGVVPKDRGDRNADPELHGIFVPLRIALQEQTRSREENPDSIIALLEQRPYVVLLGGPGSGKSTAVRHLAWSHAITNQSDLSASGIPVLSGNPLPLRIELRRLNEDRRQHPDYNFLSYATEVLLGREGVEIHPQMFKELLERRTMLLLFDGLDEVATLDERSSLVEEIEHFALSYPGNRIIVTSRPVGYELARFSSQWFSHANVQEFNDEQIRQFLERWYTHVLRLSPIPHDDQQELETLFKTLKENPRLHKLAENPLLLTVITALHRYERLPDRRILVYDRCADLLMDTWAKLKGTNMRWKDMKIGKEDQYACVAHLGFVLHKRSQEKESKNTNITEDIASDVSTRFLLREIEHFLKDRKLITEVAEQRTEAKRFLDLMQMEAGLIVERGTDESGEALYGFVHRTFQEYFAAANVYEHYQQEEDPKIISEFLKEHLHDPHWYEVTLLLLGKLKRKPVTAQLRQILDGKIKSLRSRYTDVVQQDLFFVCDCLLEEIAVENELTEVVVSYLSNLVKSSQFPLQRKEALAYLGLLMWTRQYADIGRKELTMLVGRDTIPDINTRIEAARVLYINTPIGSKEEQQAIQKLLHLAQQPDLSFEYALRSAETLYRISINDSEERRLSLQMFCHLTQRPDFSIEHIIQVALMLYQADDEASEEAKIAILVLLHLVQDPDLSNEQATQATLALYRSNYETPEWWRRYFQVLLYLAQFFDYIIMLEIQSSLKGYRFNHQVSKDVQFITQLLLPLTQHSDLSLEQTIQTAYALYWFSSKGSEAERVSIQIFRDLAQHSDLSVEQTILVTYGLSTATAKGSEEQQLAIGMLWHLAQRPDLSFQQIIQVAAALYDSSPKGSEEQQLAIGMLWHLAQRPDLSFQQIIQVAYTLNPVSAKGSKEKRVAIQIFRDLAQRSDLSVEQAIQVAHGLYESSPKGSEEQRVASQMLQDLIQDPDLSIEQIIQAALMLYWLDPKALKLQRFATQVFVYIAQNQNITVDQRLLAATEILTLPSITYLEKVQAVQIVLSLLQGKAANQHLEKHWVPISPNIKPEPSAIPYIVELVQQELLPIRARDQMYRTLRRMAPQFDKIDVPKE